MDEYMSLYGKLTEAVGLYGHARGDWARQLAEGGMIDRASIEHGVDPGVERNLYQFAQWALEAARQREIASDTTQLAHAYLTAFDQLSIVLENLKQYLANISGETDSVEHH